MTSAQFKEMVTEMFQAAGNGNVAAREAGMALRTAQKNTSLLESGAKDSPKSRSEVEKALAMYEAAKTFVTPEPKDGKPAYAIWNGKSFDVRHF